MLEVPWIAKRYKATAKIVKMSLSDCHNYLCFGVDLKNNEDIVFGFKDLKNNKILRDRIYNCSNVKFNVDAASVFYTKYDGNFWTSQVYLHIIGTN